HQTTGNGKEIAGCKQTEVAEAKRRIGIMGRLFQCDGRGNRRALLLGGRIRVCVKGHSRSERSGTARRRWEETPFAPQPVAQGAPNGTGKTNPVLTCQPQEIAKSRRF